MAMSDVGSRFAPLAEELLENRYARENLLEGAEKLRDAYARAQKRRVKPLHDRKLRAQVKAALSAFDQGSAALLSGRRKPKRTGRKLLVGLVAVGAAGFGVAMAMNEELRNSVFSSAGSFGEESTWTDGARA